MRKVELSMNEQFKYETIKHLVDHNGNKKRAALLLNCSVRHVNRLIKIYKTLGKAGFIHGNRGKSPAIAFDPAVKEKIISLYIDSYGDTNFTHFSEIIKEDLGISISQTTLNQWLRHECILSPKAHRKTRKMMKKFIKHRLDISSSNQAKNELKQALAIVDSPSAHPRRPRCKYAGEMIQMDASSFQWINDQLWHLHLAVDDASGTVVGAYFDHQETLNGYYHVLYQILNDHGIPAMFYTDRRTVFEYKRKNAAFDDDDTFTQFSYACHQLGIDIKTTSVAQAKGRIERLNQTFQSRLPVELRRANVSSIEEANEFLNHYVKKFNDQFALHLNNTKSVYEAQPDNDTINRILSVISERKLNGGHAIRFKNKYYLPKTSSDAPVYFKTGMTCLVIESFDGNLYANILDQLYCLEEIPEIQAVSKNFDSVEDTKKTNKKHHIPPLNHPWRQSTYINFKAKNSHSLAANA